MPLVVKWADTEKERQARRAQKAQSRASTAASADTSPHSSLFGAMPMGYLPPYNGYGYQVCFPSSIVKSFLAIKPSNYTSFMPILQRHGSKLPCHHCQCLACEGWTLAHLDSFPRGSFWPHLGGPGGGVADSVHVILLLLNGEDFYPSVFWLLL